MRKFKRRFYRSPAALWRDFRYVFQRRTVITEAMGGEGITPAFRERLMVMVTQVNGCRYCRYFHVNQAFKAGISEEEIRAVLEGSIPDETPSIECLALAYAQHWAEMDANPNPEYVQRLSAEYGEKTAAQIDILLGMIRVGNLLGNTFDFMLHTLSFGVLGGESRTD
jgi:AhpD family alkylhydroperoxidase